VKLGRVRRLLVVVASAAGIGQACGGSVSRDFDSAEPDGGAPADGSTGPSRLDAPDVEDAAVEDEYLVPISDEQLQALRNDTCFSWQTENEPLPLRLMLTVDVSTSMSAPVPTGGESKWEATRAALIEGLADLPALYAFGLLLFPNMTSQPSATARDPSACVATEAMIPINRRPR
jgi:hypothetical protein